MERKTPSHPRRFANKNGTRKGSSKARKGDNECPYHVGHFFMKEHDMCHPSLLIEGNQKASTQEKTKENNIDHYKSNPALIFSHNNPWSQEREKRFQARAREQLTRSRNPVAPPPVISVHTNPFPNQFSNVPDVAAQADSNPREDGCISMERVSPNAYRRAGNNFFIQ